MADPPVPAALLSAVRRDLAPVRPLASPIRRALALLPVGVALLIGIPMFWAWHRHVARPIEWPSWGLSALETAAGLTALAAGFREAIPGRELSLRAWAVVIGLVGSCFLAINASAAAPPADVPLQTTARWIGECITEAAAFSVPALAIAGWLVSRALPTRPLLTGAACGLGVGMMADAGLRLFCWDGDLLHVLLAHGGAIRDPRDARCAERRVRGTPQGAPLRDAVTPVGKPSVRAHGRRRTPRSSRMRRCTCTAGTGRRTAC